MLNASEKGNDELTLLWCYETIIGLPVHSK